MGIKQSELIPIGVLGPTPITPGGKADLSKFFQVTRTDTVATLKARVPASVSVAAVTLYGSVNSDALTTATVTLVISNNAGVISTGTYDVKGAGIVTGLVQMTNLPNIEPNPPLGDLSITATYAETGTASTVGGPWRVRVLYV